MSAPQCLRRFVIPRTHRIPYAHAQTIQEKLVADFLSYKAIVSSRDPPKEPPSAPVPTVFAFTPEPVYTTGRREAGMLTTSQICQLSMPLGGFGNEQVARIYETKRGGQITFHGPGQVVIYPILDIKSIRSEQFPNGMTARQYVEVLELTTIRALKKFGMVSFRTEDPGVWVSSEQKIAAVGVHLRRNISSFGVAVNLDTDLRWFDRIIACGLEGKRMTSMLEQVPGIKPNKFSVVWTEQFAIQLWGDPNKRPKKDKAGGKAAELPLQGVKDKSVASTWKVRRVRPFSFEERLNLLREVADVDINDFKIQPKHKLPPKLVKLSDTPHPADLLSIKKAQKEPIASVQTSKKSVSLTADVSDFTLSDELSNQLFPIPIPEHPNFPKQPVQWKDLYEVESFELESSSSTLTRGSPLANYKGTVGGSAEGNYRVHPMSSKPRKDELID